MWYEILSCCLIFLVLYLFMFNGSGYTKNVPPGPPALPVIGNLLLLGKNNAQIHLTFRELREKYGDVFSLRIGGTLTVVVNGYDALKEAFVKNGDVFSDRPDVFIFKDVSKHQGLAGSSGTLWKEHRAFALSALRDFGFGKKSLESKIMEEVEIFLECVEMKSGEPFNIHALVQTSIANIICSIVFGQRYEHSDDKFTKMMEMFDANFRLFKPILNFFPVLKYVPGDPFQAHKILKNCDTVYNFIWNLILEHNETMDENNVRDYIDAYLKERKQRSNGNVNTFTDFQMLRSIGDLFSAGTETTTTSIRWAIVFFLHHPEVVDRMYTEIDEVIGSARFPSLKDKENLPYCEAVVSEVIRKANVAPVGVFHGCNQDTNFHGYTIPKGTVMMPNLDSVLSDPDFFPHPEDFDPTRFLDRNGKFAKNDKLIAFSIGRRACLGEALAKMELFLFLTCIVQRFKILPENDQETPSLVGIMGFTHSPQPFNVRLVKRF